MLNNVSLIGRTTADPDITRVKNSDILNFSLAVNTGKEEVSFINCVAFDKTANIINDNVAKGDNLGVSGFLRQRKWTTKEGVEKSTFEVVVQSLHLLGGAKKEDPVPDAAFPPVEEAKEDIPEGYYKGEDGKLHKNKTTAKK